MSTALHDVGANAVIGSSFSPTVLIGSANGAAVDLAEGDGNGFAILTVGDVTDGGSVATELEESDDGTTWTALTGVTFDPMTTQETTQVQSFRRTKRYVRMAVTVAGLDPELEFAGLIGQQKKTI